MTNIFKYLWYKLYLNIIGAWKGSWDMTFNRHRRLPDGKSFCLVGWKSSLDSIWSFFAGLPNQTGKNVVLTGGNRGIGFETVKKLLPLGFNVILGMSANKYLMLYYLVVKILFPFRGKATRRNQKSSGKAERARSKRWLLWSVQTWPDVTGVCATICQGNPRQKYSNPCLAGISFPLDMPWTSYTVRRM